MRLITFIVAFSVFMTIQDLPSLIIPNFRLSRQICPVRYTVEITPFFLARSTSRRFMFTGRTFINIYANTKDVQEFSINAGRMEIFSVLVFKVEARTRVPFTYDYNATAEKITFRMEESLAPFLMYSLNFKYIAQMSLGDAGIYVRSYIDDEGDEKWLVMTQLRPTHARKLFPGFDDPYFKSIYDVFVSHPENYTSYSNTFLARSRNDGSELFYEIERYRPTPPFSTYQVAMIVCDFVPRGEDGLYVIARPELINYTDFSFVLGRQILSFYSGLFRVPYYSMGNNILQMVAVPHFGKVGGDAWGLLLFDEDDLIVEDQEDLEQSSILYMMRTLSYKISRNWLGGAVTCEWWGYLWVVDGLARYHEYFATHALFPEYGLDQLFVVEQLHVILNTDETNMTQPLTELYLTSSEAIARKIGDVTYMKGASVIRMFRHCITEDQFEKMIAQFIEKNREKAITSVQFLELLKSYIPPSENFKVGQFFSDWTEQVGFPILSVSLSKDGSTVIIEQKRYIIHHDGSDPTIRYTIPITYATSVKPDFNKTLPVEYFNKDKASMTFRFIPPIEWIMFNIQQTSYYRVMYDKRLWNNLHHALCQENWSGIHELNRAQYIDDLLSYGKAGLFNYDEVFKWLDYLRTETEYIPWKTALNGFEYIVSHLTGEDQIYFGEYFLFLTEKVYKKLGVIGPLYEPIMDIYTRREIVNWNCRYGRQECISETERLVNDYLYNGTTIPVDMRATVYCNGMRNAAVIEYDRLFAKLESEISRREMLRIRYGLSCSRNIGSIEMFLRLILSEDVAPEEKLEALEPLYKENTGNAWLLFKLIKSDVHKISNALHGYERIADLIIGLSQFFTTREQKEDFLQFVRVNRIFFTKVYLDKLNDAYGMIDYKQKWTLGYLGSFRSYLKSGTWTNTSWNKRNATSTNFINLFLLTLVTLFCVLF